MEEKRAIRTAPELSPGLELSDLASAELGAVPPRRDFSAPV
jgi:hypothetical protein